MKTIIAIILLITLLNSIEAQVSIESDSNKSAISTQAKSDSVSYIKIINDDPLISYQSIIGALVGSLLATLIAVYSIKRTHKNQLFLENEKIHNERHIQEKVYCGFLFAILSILLNHKEISKALRKELNFFIKNVEETGDLVIEQPYNRYSIDLLKEFLSKTLSFQNYDSNTTMYLVTYVNKLENFESNLNFIPLLKIREQHKDKTTYAQSVATYFSDLHGLIDILDELNDLISELILNYLNESDVVDMHSYLERLQTQQDKPNAPL